MSAAPQPRAIAPAPAQASQPCWFLVDIRGPGNSRRTYTREGGAAWDHLNEAVELAGAGARISVRPSAPGGAL